MSAPVVVQSIRVENLRGYRDSRLSLGGLRLLVGDNNQGKSGLLRLLAWLLNEAEEALLCGRRRLNDREVELLLPANQAAGRARRITLAIRFNDRRHARRYEGEIVELRASFQKQPALARLNLGRPARNEQHDPEAMRLLRLVRNKVRLLFVPSVRDGSSDRFAAAWRRTLTRLFLSRFRQNQPGGTALEYRQSRSFLRALEERLPEVKETLQKLIAENLPPGMLDDVALRLRATPADMGDWLETQVSLRISTGLHDRDHVSPAEVGNGLQSLLHLSLGLAEHVAQPLGRQMIAAVEEPEAFLHPSGQRGIATTLRKLSERPDNSVLITTHSPYFIDEAEYGEVVLVRDHNLYEAGSVADQQRNDINTALMSTESAEVFFSGGVLLVEGPGEVAFFKTLLKRLRSQTGEPRLSRLTVMEVGGKHRFAPWWRLMRSYGKEGDRPVRSLSLFDADAASAEDGERAALRAIRDAGLNVSASTRSRLENFGDLPWTEIDQREREVRAINRELADLGVFFFSFDLEWATFGAIAAATPDLPAAILGVSPEGDRTPAGLARRAGSKVTTGHSDKTFKKPHLRQQLAQQADLNTLPAEVRNLIRRWMSLAGLPPADQDRLVP